MSCKEHEEFDARCEIVKTVFLRHTKLTSNEMVWRIGVSSTGPCDLEGYQYGFCKACRDTGGCVIYFGSRMFLMLSKF